MKRTLSAWLVCASLSFVFASADSRTAPGAAKDTADSRVSDAKVREFEAALASVKADADSIKKKDDDRQVASDSRLRELEASSATLKAAVEMLKKDDSFWLKILPIIISAAALGLGVWQYLKKVPSIKGRPFLDWPPDPSSVPPGLPRPNFQLKLRNETDSEVILTKVIFHLKSATGEESDVPLEFAEKLLVLPSGHPLERKIPVLKILDVVSVEAHSPTKAWGIEWKRRRTRRCAAFKSIKTEFFFNERNLDEMVLDVFQAGEAFYVRKAGYSPSIYDYGFVKKHESEAAALKQFENERVKNSDYSVADNSKFCMISGAQSYFWDYW